MNNHIKFNYLTESYHGSPKNEGFQEECPSPRGLFLGSMCQFSGVYLEYVVCRWYVDGWVDDSNQERINEKKKTPWGRNCTWILKGINYIKHE